jgi:hypothetical protein
MISLSTKARAPEMAGLSGARGRVPVNMSHILDNVNFWRHYSAREWLRNRECAADHSAHGFYFGLGSWTATVPGKQNAQYRLTVHQGGRRAIAVRREKCFTE